MDFIDLPLEIKMHIVKFVGSPIAALIKTYFKKLTTITILKRTLRLEIYMRADAVAAQYLLHRCISEN